MTTEGSVLLNMADETQTDIALRTDIAVRRHLPRDALHSAGAYANFAGNFVHAFTCAQIALGCAFQPCRLCGADPASYRLIRPALARR